MKRLLWMTLILLSGFILWRHYEYSRVKFLQGSTISLIDRLQEDHIVRSHFKAPLKLIQNEKLGGWRKIVKFHSASIWTTDTESLVSNQNRTSLTCDGKEFKREKNVFRSDIAPGSWNFFQNQIFIAAVGDTFSSSCFLSYETYKQTNDAKITGEELVQPRALSYGIQLFTLSRPMAYPGRLDTVLRKNGEAVRRSDWRYVYSSPALIFQSSVLGMFQMFGRTEVYSKEFYFREGLANLQITAKADLAGSEFPRVGIYLDKRKISEVEIKSVEKEQVSSMIPLTEGYHRLELIFENDFYEPNEKADRNVGIYSLQIEYQPAIAVRAPLPGSSRYTIDYWISDSTLKSYSSNFMEEQKREGRLINSISAGIVSEEEFHRTMMLAPGDRVVFPVEIPNSASLEFAAAKTSARIKITIHRALHFPETIFSTGLTDDSNGNAQNVPLNSYAGQKVFLSIENTSSKHDPADFLFLRNPRIVSTENKDRTLFVIFSFDALRADHVSAYGYHRKTTPNIDAFARDSVLFEQAYTAEPWTLSSFASLFTSLYPSFHNVRQIDQSLDASLAFLPELLHKEGYVTGAFVDNPFLHPLYGFSRGFDAHNFHMGNVEERIHSAIQWLRSSQAEKQFLFLHILNPHSPYTAPAKYAKELLPDPNLISNTGAYRRLMNREGCAAVNPDDLNEMVLQYDSEIRQADDLFQSLITAMKDSRLYENATIIVMSDHGEEFLDHGRLWHGENVFSATARVPLLIKFPANLQKRGIRIPNPVNLVDITPTLLDLANIQRPVEMQGTSLLVNPDPGRTLFTESRKGVLGIIQDRYHYIYTGEDSGTPACPASRREELYDLIADPEEKNDLSAQFPDRMEFFRKQRKSYFEGATQFRKSRFSEKSKQVAPDSELKEQMRALGYIH